MPDRGLIIHDISDPQDKTPRSDGWIILSMVELKRKLKIKHQSPEVAVNPTINSTAYPFRY